MKTNFNENWDGVVRRSLAEATEYAIWGIPKGEKEETLLIAMPNGKPITDKAVAERLKQLAITKFGATKVRIQAIDGSAPDFRKTIGKR